MKKNSNTLFQLIKKMDRGERRFFNIFCNRQGKIKEKVYLRLFKDILKQDQYDEAILKKEFNNYGKQFKMAKNYLYNLILNSLVQYYTQENLSLYDQLLKIRVLFEKGLFEPIQKLIYKTRKLAKEQSNFLVTIETIKLESSLLLISGGLTIERINAFQKQIVHYITLHKELELYKQMYDKVAFFEFKYVRMFRDDIKKEKEFTKIAHSTLFMNTNKPRSTISNWLLLCTRGMYYKILDDFTKSQTEYFSAIKILDSNPKFKENYPDYVAQALKGYIVSSFAIKKFDVALEKLSELKTFCSLYSTINTRTALLNCKNAELYVYIDTDRKNEAMQLINEIEERIRKEEVGDSNKLIFYSNASITCTLFSEYQKSLDWVNKVFNFEFVEKKFPNMYCSARIMQLINLVELKEYDLLFYRMKSFHRYLGKQNSIYSYQEIFMNFIRRILKDKFNKNNLPALYKNVKESLVNVLKDPEEARNCDYFDFVGWFESKIDNIPYTTWIKTHLKLNQALT